MKLVYNGLSFGQFYYQLFIQAVEAHLQTFQNRESHQKEDCEGNG